MCNKVFTLCFVFVCFALVCMCSGKEIGEICLVETLNVAGTCRNISECNYAKKILYVDEKKPQMCKWEGRTRIVCCPNADIMAVTGVFGRMFDVIDNGIKKSKSTTCRYDGREPLICCKNKVDVKPPPETGCPALNIPTVTPSTANIAWKKCAEYQRYVHRCVASDEDPDKLIRKDVCAIPDRGYRISAGRPAETNEFPHMALIGIEDHNAKGLGVKWIGGGSLISDKFVLTAAHVLAGSGSAARYVLFGTLNKKDTVNSLLFYIIRRIPYKLYDLTKKIHDIALVELHQRVMLSEFVRPACLPVPEITVEKTPQRIVAGWGRVAETAKTSDILLTAQVTPGICKKNLTSNFVYNPASMICAFGQFVSHTQATDTCKGDSGGPLMAVASNLDCTYVVEGIVSFGPECGRGSEAIYTNASYYLNWIISNVWPEEANESSS